MKKVFFAAGLAAVICLTGCNALYEKFGTTPEELHDLAVEKVTDYAEDAINKKIESSANSKRKPSKTEVYHVQIVQEKVRRQEKVVFLIPPRKVERSRRGALFFYASTNSLAAQLLQFNSNVAGIVGCAFLTIFWNVLSGIFWVVSSSKRQKFTSISIAKASAPSCIFLSSSASWTIFFNNSLA